MKLENNLFHNLIDRRSFLQALTYGTAGLMACASNQQKVIYSQNISKKISAPGKSIVIFRTGTDRRETIYQALKPMQKDVENAIGNRQVVVKVNAGLLQPKYAQYSTHVDELRAILDFLKPIYDRQVIISEGTASMTTSILGAYENYGYLPLENEYNVKFIDANDQPTTVVWIRAAKQHPVPINVIYTYMDPDVYLISAARLKTHDTVVGTYSLKNVVMGSPQCRYKQKIKVNISDKPKMHGGAGLPDPSSGRELSYNLFTVALAGVRPDLAVIDGIQSIEGNGPWNGNVVDHGVVIASTDFVAADRMCTELMGIDPEYMKYIEWCGDAGMGNFDLSKININGPDYKDHVIKYKLNKNIEGQIAWIHRNFDE